MGKVLKLILSIFLMIPPTANADWIRIHVGEVFNTYADNASLNAQPEGIYAWGLYDFINKQPEGYGSAKVLFHIDCRQSKYKMLSVNTYEEKMGKGESGTPKRSDNWETATPDSLGFHIVEHVCDL
jgi:hypothetical protein